MTTTTILSDNGVSSGSAGLKTSGGNDGTLVLQTTTSGGTATTALTLNNVQGVSVPNTFGVGGATPSTSGAGITFPASQSASSDANTLDDYEEGTWSPTLTFSVSTGTITYTQRNGGYTKIGNTVHYYAVISVSSIGASSGNASFSNLPFAAVSGYKEECQPYMAYNLNSNVYSVTSYTQSSNLILCKQASAGASTISGLVNTDFTTGTTIHCSGTYTIA